MVREGTEIQFKILTRVKVEKMRDSWQGQELHVVVVSLLTPLVRYLNKTLQFSCNKLLSSPYRTIMLLHIHTHNKCMLNPNLVGHLIVLLKTLGRYIIEIYI